MTDHADRARQIVAAVLAIAGVVRTPEQNIERAVALVANELEKAELDGRACIAGKASNDG